MSLKKYVNSIDMNKNPTRITVHTVLKNVEDFAEIVCHQEILVGQTEFDYVREVTVVEYSTNKKYFTSRVRFGERTIHEVFENFGRVSFVRQWLPNGEPVVCTRENIKEVFKATIEQMNKKAMVDLSRAIY